MQCNAMHRNTGGSDTHVRSFCSCLRAIINWWIHKTLVTIHTWSSRTFCGTVRVFRVINRSIKELACYNLPPWNLPRSNNKLHWQWRQVAGTFFPCTNFIRIFYMYWYSTATIMVSSKRNSLHLSLPMEICPKSIQIPLCWYTHRNWKLLGMCCTTGQ